MITLLRWQISNAFFLCYKIINSKNFLLHSFPSSCSVVYAFLLFLIDVWSFQTFVERTLQRAKYLVALLVHISPDDWKQLPKMNKTFFFSLPFSFQNPSIDSTWFSSSFHVGYLKKKRQIYCFCSFFPNV